MEKNSTPLNQLEEPITPVHNDDILTMSIEKIRKRILYIMVPAYLLMFAFMVVAGVYFFLTIALSLIFLHLARRELANSTSLGWWSGVVTHGAVGVGLLLFLMNEIVILHAFGPFHAIIILIVFLCFSILKDLLSPEVRSFFKSENSPPYNLFSTSNSISFGLTLVILALWLSVYLEI